MKKIVIPGELLTDDKKKLGQNVYSRDGKIYSMIVGILSESDKYVSVIPLNGSYIPNEGDGIILIVSSEVSVGFVLDYNFTNDTFIPKSTLSKNLDIGTVIFARIKEKKGIDSIDLDNINILPKGNILKVSPVKVPRLIGKNDSMINLLKEYTKSEIVIGKNGWICYNSKNPKLLERTINLICKNSQKTNLTDNIKSFLEKNIKR